MRELEQDEQLIFDFLKRYGWRVSTSDLVELAYERGMSLTWHQVDAIRAELRELEVRAWA